MEQHNDEFVRTEVIVDRIAHLLQRHSDSRIFDEDVANVLRMPTGTLDSCKKRDKTPVKQVVLFCRRTGLDPMDILFLRGVCHG